MIGEGVIGVDDGAFAGCTGISKVRINSQYVPACFRGKPSVKEIVLGDNVSEVCNYAFEECNGLTSVSVGRGVKTIGIGAFSGCRDLKRVYVSDLSSWCGIDFMDFVANPLSYAGELFLNGLPVRNLVIPSGITTVKDYLFINCPFIESVVIHKDVTDIAHSAFMGCNSLKRVEFDTPSVAPWFSGNLSVNEILLGKNVTDVADGAFGGCLSLKRVEFNCPSVAPWFNGNTSLAEVSFGSGVTNVDADALKGCMALKKVEIDTDSVGAWMNGLLSVEELVLSENVRCIEKDALDGCTGIKKIYVSAPTPPEVLKGNFKRRHYNNAELYVSKGYLDVYSDADVWEKFDNIMEY